MELPQRLSGRESTCSAGDGGSVPGLGRAPGEGNGNPLQYSCLGNPIDERSLAGYIARGGLKKSWTQLSDQKQTKNIVFKIQWI